jgi:hypothetical protein
VATSLPEANSGTFETEFMDQFLVWDWFVAGEKPVVEVEGVGLVVIGKAQLPR